jgi:hypothetical protein
MFMCQNEGNPVDGDKIHPSKETADKQEPIGYIIKHGI